MSPAYYLLVFAGLCLVSFYLFRPRKGWFWLLQQQLQKNKQTITEDLLKQLYHQHGASLSIDTLFRTQEVQRSYFLSCLQETDKKGLIRIEQGKVSLLEPGRQYALMIIRSHRLWEHYLSEKTGYQKEEWHERAEKMEHLMTQQETNELAQQLGNPRYDPHGDPIPSETGELLLQEEQALSSFKKGEQGIISHIEDEPKELYQALLSYQLNLGAQVSLLSTNADYVHIRSEGSTQQIPALLAQNIYLKASDQPQEEVHRLSSLQKGEFAQVQSISRACRGENRRRLLDLGFVKGSKVELDTISPLQDPKAYRIRNTAIALREEQAQHILIKKEPA